MSKVVKGIIGVVMTVVGVVTGQPWLIASGVSMLASTAINALLAPSASGATERQAVSMSISLGEQPREAIFGRAVVPGSLLDAFNYGGKYGTDWEVLIVALADHRCEALLGYYVNDVYVAHAGDGAVSGYNGQLEVYARLGTAGQSPPAILTSYGGWDAGDRLRGGTYAVVAYKSDAQDAASPIWPSGRPRFRFDVKGVRCYDPRHDSTVSGGSGAHRRADPATWAWTDNAEICRYNYDLGLYAEDDVGNPNALLIGRGLSLAEAPPEKIFAAANLCDEDVALAAGGTEKRYRCGGVIRANEEYGAVEKMFAAAMGGILIQPEGTVQVEPGHGKAPSFYFTDADIVVGTTVSFSELRSEADREWVNTVAARYVEPAQNWTDHSAPVRRNSADVIADGGPREDNPMLRMVVSGTQAQRIAEIRRRQGRLTATATVTLGPPFCEVEEGDIGVWTSARRFGGVPRAFRVERYSLDEKWRNTLVLREMTTQVYDWEVGDEIADGASAEANDPRGAYGMPPATDWAVTGTVVASGPSELPAIVVAGSVTDRDCIGVLIEFAHAGSGDWTALPVAAPSTTRQIITAVSGATSYDVGVTYFYDNGRGTRRVLGPVTTGALDIAASVPLGTNLLANSHFREGLAQWGFYYDGTASGGGPAVLSITSAGALRLNNPNNQEWNIGSVGAVDGTGLRGGRRLFRLNLLPGETVRVAWRGKGTVSGVCHRIVPYFRVLNQAANADLGGAWGDVHSFPGVPWQINASNSEAAGYVDIGHVSGIYWLDVEWFGLTPTGTEHGAGAFELSAAMLAFIDPAQTTPPVWSEGITGDYRATKNSLYVSSSAPSAPTDGDLWKDTSTNPPKFKFRVSGAWVDVSNLVTDTNQLADGAGLGLTATWANIGGSGKPQNDATKNTYFVGASDPGGSDGSLWKDTSTTPARFRLKISGSWVDVSSLVTDTAQITDGANLGLTAVWGGITGSGKPEDGATRNHPRGDYSAGATYDPGDTVVWTVASGGDGKGHIRIGTGQTTGVAPSDGAKWSVYVERGQQGAAGASGYSISPSSIAINIPCSDAGIPNTGALPLTRTFQVLQGVTDLSDDAATTYAVSATGISAAMGGTNGKVLTLSAPLTADHATVTVTISRSGTPVSTIAGTVDKQRAGASALSDIESSVTAPTGTSYGAANVTGLAVMSGTDGGFTLATDLFYNSGSAADTIVYGKFQYRNSSDGSTWSGWSDVAAEATGIPGNNTDTGELMMEQTLSHSGPPKFYQFQVLLRRNAIAVASITGITQASYA